MDGIMISLRVSNSENKFYVVKRYVLITRLLKTYTPGNSQLNGIIL